MLEMIAASKVSAAKNVCSDLRAGEVMAAMTSYSAAMTGPRCKIVKAKCDDKGSEGLPGSAPLDEASQGSSQTDIAKLGVKKFASEAYPQWAIRNPDKPCPASLLELAHSVGKTEADTKDPWGTPYKMLCGTGQLPAGVTDGIAVTSFGPDKVEGTADDIRSW